MSTLQDGVAHAMTANAFTSVSLDPPLVLVCVDKGVRMHAAVLDWLRGDLRQISALKSALIFRRVGRHNARHMLFAWVTLGSLVVTDAYIALVSSGAFSDLRIIN